MTMKGILLAGGSGTRLHPMTLVSSKQLLPVYDKPMVYYPLTTLMLAGIREILVISTPDDLPKFEKLLGNGSQWGMKFQFQVQPKPEGLAQALILAESFLGGSPSCLILGDNIFYGHGFPEKLQKAKSLSSGALVFGYQVNDPHRYGVVKFDSTGRVLDLIEKPKDPPSDFAVPGVYFYDSTAPVRAKKLRPSARGELEITDLNKSYLSDGQLRVEILGRGIAWLDTGTEESLLEASNFISVIEKRQGLKVGCPEEIAYRLGYINSKDLLGLADKFSKNKYGDYLKRIVSSAKGIS